MIVVMLRGPLGPNKDLKDFEIKRVTRPEQVLGTCIFRILKVESKDSIEFYRQVYDRIHISAGDTSTPLMSEEFVAKALAEAKDSPTFAEEYFGMRW